MAAAVCPIFETHVAVLFNTGRLVIFELYSNHKAPEPLDYRLHSLTQHIALDRDLRQSYGVLRFVI